MKIAIQGIAGSFHHEAAIKMLGPDIKLLPCNTFQQVFEAVIDSRADQGVVAIENNLHGSINTVYRLLARHRLWVSAETTLQIEQFLITAKDLGIEAVEKVFSQAPAIAQCELWLEKHLPQAHIEETHDTADSVRFILHHATSPFAAIAGKQAAARYGGTIIAGPINDDPHNYTRFFLIGRAQQTPDDATKTSIILETNHQPAALYNALGVFAETKINLSKLDSHPIANDQRHYAFYIDFEARLDNQIERRVFEKLCAQGCRITVLGSYKIIN